MIQLMPSGSRLGLSAYLKLVRGVSLILTPLPLLSVMAFLIAITSILIGLLAELVTRTYYESQGKSIYLVRSTLNIEGQT